MKYVVTVTDTNGRPFESEDWQIKTTRIVFGCAGPAHQLAGMLGQYGKDVVLAKTDEPVERSAAEVKRAEDLTNLVFCIPGGEA